ncbi:MAG: hypothetical protein QM477_10415 [Planctomycetota bacterium]
MRAIPPFLLVASSLLLAACGPSGSISAPSGNQALTSGSAGSTALDQTSPNLIEIPSFVYPEGQAISLDRIFHVRNASGDLERVQETFLADGLGQTRLDAIGYAPNQAQAFVPAPSMLQMNYLNQMRFMVKYRDPHLGERVGLLRNFRWSADPVPVQVAGVSCTKYTAESKHELGDVEFLADSQTGLLLGWTYFDNIGQVLMRMETTSMNLNPNLGGVVWSVPLVSDQAFDMSNDLGLLGFTPMEPEYLPPGFYPEAAWLRFSAGAAFQSTSNMLVKIFSDGIHLVFVAQHTQDNRGQIGLSLANKVVEVYESDLGGIRVAEGLFGKQKLYVASLLEMDEIETVFGSLSAQ